MHILLQFIDCSAWSIQIKYLQVDGDIYLQQSIVDSCTDIGIVLATYEESIYRSYLRQYPNIDVPVSL